MKVFWGIAIAGILCCVSDAIREGQPTQIVYNPHLVSIAIGNEFACAGSLLTLDWVVTVASCVQTIQKDKIQVRAGSWKTNAFGQIRDVEKIVIHPMFNFYTQDYDLALLKVKKPYIKNIKVRPITIAKDPVTDDQELVVVGWGEDRHGHDGDLKKLQVKLWSHDRCQMWYRYSIVSPRMICTWKNINSSPTWNDFGDPLKNQWGHLVGMYTWADECKGCPSLYTYLHPYLPWISKRIPELDTHNLRTEV